MGGCANLIRKCRSLISPPRERDRAGRSLRARQRHAEERCEDAVEGPVSRATLTKYAQTEFFSV
jgi:hypothetical protein